MNKEFARVLIEKCGSPLYAYDLEEVERRAQALLAMLPAGSSLLFSVKANPLPVIGEVLSALGCRAEISSTGEMVSALEAGFKPSRILYGGPAKSVEEMKEALDCGIRTFSCESWNDLARLQLAAYHVDSTINVLLRVNPLHSPQALLAMTGVHSQFGFEEADLLQESSRLVNLPVNFEVIGVHIYFGTQMSGVSALGDAAASALQTAERLSKQLNLQWRVVNMGGGFPWPHGVNGVGPDLSELGPILYHLSLARELTASAQMWFESGRYLTASSGTLLARVVDIKSSKGKKYIVLDSGINHLGGMSGLGRIMRPAVSIEPLQVDPVQQREVVDLVGPLCSPLDCLARSVEVPVLQIDDIISIPNVGAYGATASLTNFLSRVPPLEVAHRSAQVVKVYRLGCGHKAVDQRHLHERFLP